jgi:hypothetical protein
MVVAASGCAANLTAARSGRAAGQWSVQLPSNDTSVARLAYGRHGNSEPAAVSGTDLPAATKTPRLAPKHALQPAAKLLAVTSTTAGSSHAAAPAKTEPVQLAMADTSAEQRYSARQSRQLERFKGGDAIVIGVSTVLIALLVLLLILLIL